MKNEARSRFLLPPSTMLGLLSFVACSGPNGITSSSPLPLRANGFAQPSIQQIAKDSICEKLLKGDPNVPVKIDCSGSKDQMSNAEVCDLRVASAPAFPSPPRCS